MLNLKILTLPVVIFFQDLLAILKKFFDFFQLLSFNIFYTLYIL